MNLTPTQERRLRKISMYCAAPDLSPWPTPAYDQMVADVAYRAILANLEAKHATPEMVDRFLAASEHAAVLV